MGSNCIDSGCGFESLFQYFNDDFTENACPVPNYTPTPKSAPKTSDEPWLNQVSEYPLSALDTLGGLVEELENQGDASSQNSEPSNSNKSSYLERFSEGLHGVTYDENGIENGLEDTFQSSVWAKSIEHSSHFLNAATGVLTVAKSFHDDRTSGDDTYRGTIKSIVNSTLQIGTSSAAGVAVGGTAATILTGATAPILLGGAAAIGAGYLAGKALEWGWSKLWN